MTDSARHPVFAIHICNFRSGPLALADVETRPTIVNPLPALGRVRRSIDGIDVHVGRFGTAVAIQRLGTATDEQAARRMFEDDECFEPAYARAVRAIRTLAPGELDDFDSSTLWFGRPGDADVGWSMVVVPPDETATAIVVEAAMLYLLAELTSDAIAKIPGLRAKGRIDPSLSDYTSSLFAAEQPSNYLVRATEIALMRRFYDGWHLGATIEQLKGRFDQATSAHAFVWEHAERRRDVVMNMLLAVVAVVGLLQADSSLASLSGLAVQTVDLLILAVAAGVGGIALYHATIKEPVQRWIGHRRRRSVNRALRKD